ncbi:NAD-dependent protein deacetylase [Pseudactinotalea terrae]|uniref:NAD-dependent protein deacetylase n=1 Tax=Pseudactinotalea terrae TaxID=1743262 RepID=UPI00147968EA
MTKATRLGTVSDAVGILARTRLAVLTGAGISTDSGIPDYRGPDSPPRNPMTFQQFAGDQAFRRHYWARNHVGWRHMRTTRPNAGHRALAGLERRGLLSGIITQNVDLLHEQAGATNVIDLHGHYNEVICLTCKTVFTREHMHERLDEANPDFAVEVGDVEIAPDADAVLSDTAGFVVPPCEVCGGILKPNIVYFGENVPKERVAAAYEMVDDGGALLVAGSSLAVMSGLRFVRHAAKAGKPVVIVNRGETRGDALATLLVDDGTSEFLAELAASLPDL